MIPISTDTPIRRTPWVNYGLIAGNIFIHMLGYLMTSPGMGLSEWRDYGVLNGADPELYQFFTYQFLHAPGIAHLGGNMLFLWVFGNPVNAKLGDIPYLFFYLAGGVFAATGYLWAHDNPMVGASGSIAAVTTAYLALFPRSYIRIVYWFIFIGTFEIPSMLLIVFKMIIWDNILALQMVGESNIAFAAHLAGYGFGFFSAALLLALRALPRDQFDIIALWRRWLQRRGMEIRMRDPNERARAQFGRVARPVSSADVNVGPEPYNQVTDFRMKIAQALAQNDRETAALQYEKLLEIDPRQVLARGQQLEIANQLYTLQRLPQAASAYEKYLTAYPKSPDVDQVKLLLGIIYARDLQQYEIAEAHLRQLLERLGDDRRREQCRHWLQVVTDALGRPAAGT